ncbi:UNVERIFIED_CONTAM: Photosystem I chlorophyll a apoprotein A2, partial [Sesamum indicum]
LATLTTEMETERFVVQKCRISSESSFVRTLRRVITSLVAQHMYSLPAYAFIAQDFTTQAALYTHHQYIAGFIMTGAFAHGAIFFIRDYNPEQNEDNVLARMLDHKEAIISHLSWASLFLGFHTLGLYVHNDVMLAFGTPEKQILIEPIFAQWIQSAHAARHSMRVEASGCPGWLNAVNENTNSLFLTIGPGDFLVHHAIALGLHTTTLILVKGALDARGSKLMPDKKDFGYSFPCDGPGRGGTCDISAWDAFYLAVFWMLNTIGWVTFYWHWKHITLWQGNVSQFNESSTYLMGWLRDYLWLNSSQLINGYNPFGMNSLSVWAWMFLFGHLVWATGFMFLISWRGYWQELIETLAWAHERTPLANLIRWRDKPVALSIVQARLVGLAHFSDLNHYGKEKFDSEGEEEAKIGTEISFDSSILKKRNNYNPHHGIVHLHAFIAVVFRPEDRELTIETLDYPDTYFVKWFMHVCCQEQQDQVDMVEGHIQSLFAISFDLFSSARGRAVW